MESVLENNNKIKSLARNFIIAVVAVLTASLIRKLFLGALDDKVVWITFYPAVMVAAIFGGFSSGLLTAVFTIIIVTFKWNLFTETPFIDGDLGTISIIVFLLNCSLISGISEYSRRQKIKANIQKQKAEHASKAKSEFLANISHELRTPLNAILGFTHLMQDSGKIQNEELKSLKIIGRSGEHLLALINNVLDIAKIESGRTTKTEISFNLENMIYEVVQIMSKEAENKNLQLKTILKEDVPNYIRTDKQKLKQILLNLIGNAIKFTNSGQITLSLKKKMINEQMFLIMNVEDTGIGITKVDLERIFNPFEQSSNASTQKGTGLGLSISKQYANLLGGEITVKSEAGVGSNFSVEIPLVPSLSESSKQQSNKYYNVNSVVSGQTNFRILIVEDQIENWLLLKQIHEKIGLQVKVAENGHQGLEIFKEWQPHLIWMDIRMPVMNGLEATKKIRLLNNGKTVKIVGISAHVFKDEIQNILSAGMDDFIKKPYLFHEIYQCLNEQIGIDFIFNKTEPEIEQKPLQSNLFENIDIKLLQQLQIAIKNLNKKQMELAIHQIQKIDSEAAQTLLTHVHELKYTEIYRALNSYFNSKNI